ncbi:unnamed protein product [Leuciscus chuanchicus]
MLHVSRGDGDSYAAGDALISKESLRLYIKASKTSSALQVPMTLRDAEKELYDDESAAGVQNRPMWRDDKSILS